VAGILTLACVVCIYVLKLVTKLVDRDMASMEADDERRAVAAAARAAGSAEKGGVAGEPAAPVVSPNRGALGNMAARSFNAFTNSFVHGVNYDIHETVEDDAQIRAMHAQAEVFDVKSELCFKYLQVLTACTNSFAHGANDVANAVGAMAAVYSIWNCSCASSKSNVSQPHPSPPVRPPARCCALRGGGGGALQGMRVHALSARCGRRKSCACCLPNGVPPFPPSHPLSPALHPQVPIWMFAIGGVGLVVGLATYGYNIMKVRQPRCALWPCPAPPPPSAPRLAPRLTPCPRPPSSARRPWA
jgi:phosphate/sulfate permease